jgi:hypothetical protein
MRCARSVLLALLLLLALVPAASAQDGAAPDHRDTAAELAGADINRALTLSRLAGTRSADLPQYLPTTWCGSERTTDDTANAAYSSALRQIKVVYAYANDMTDRFSAWRDAIQADVSRIDQYLALQTGGRRALRFDMGTACGPQYVDVQVVHLPQNASVYTNDPSEFNELADDVATAVGVAAGRDVFVIGDELAKPADGIWGIAEVGNGSASNGGTLTAIMWTPPGTTPSASGWQPTVMLHEITHNLGGVPTNAPNATSFSHCTDGEDVMCYPDGSPEAANYSSTVCPTAGGDIPQTYDCGHDDYFNPDPAPGNWLADPSHWNVYNSSFFGPCSQLGKACGDNVVPTPPVNTTLPSIAGAAQRGVALTASAAPLA